MLKMIYLSKRYRFDTLETAKALSRLKSGRQCMQQRTMKRIYDDPVFLDLIFQSGTALSKNLN